MTRSSRRLPVAGLAVVAAGLAVLVGGWLLLHRLTPARLDRVARQWAVSKVLASSDSVYRLSVGHIGVHPTGVSVDSIRLVTDTARNARRAHPLPIVSLVLRGGHADGLNLPALLTNRDGTVRIEKVRFDKVEADIRRTPQRDDSARKQSDGDSSTARPSTGVMLLALGRGALPAGSPVIQVGRVELPWISAVVHPAPSEPARSHSVERLAVRLDRVLLASRDSVRNPIYAGNVTIRAQQYRAVWSPLVEVTAATVSASLRDSTFRLEGLEIHPTMTDAELRRHLRWRHTRFAIRAPMVEAHGVDYARLPREGVIVRSLDVEEPVADLLLDKNLEPDPHPSPAPTPQRVMRKLRWRLTIDTIRARNGLISYGELNPDRAKPGVVTFEHIEGTVANLSNDPARMSADHPMVVRASTMFMGTGRASVVLEIPLLADSLTMRYRGRLGPMPLTAFNRFAAVNARGFVRRGRAHGVVFDGRIRNDYATGRVVFRYRDLKLGVNGKGGGIAGKVARHVGSFIVNNFKLQRDNPPDGDPEKLHSAPIARRREPADDLVPFLWFSLRDAMVQIMMP